MRVSPGLCITTTTTASRYLHSLLPALRLCFSFFAPQSFFSFFFPRSPSRVLRPLRGIYSLHKCIPTYLKLEYMSADAKKRKENTNKKSSPWWVGILALHFCAHCHGDYLWDERVKRFVFFFQSCAAVSSYLCIYFFLFECSILSARPFWFQFNRNALHSDFAQTD